jgi:radical SAM superfamily enzyme YgiQ (UPF0313 family)
MAPDYDLLVLFTSTPGFNVDVRIAEMMKGLNPSMKVAFVGPPVTIEPEKSLTASTAIDFVVKKEFDYAIRDYALGVPIEQIPSVVFRKEDGSFQHNPEAPVIEDLDALPWASKTYHRDLDFTRYNVPFLLHPYVSFYTSRGCPAQCTFCLWPQTHSGHRWRLRSSDDIVNECRYILENFKGLKEIFFDDDTFNYQKKRTIELCGKLKTLKFTWSCTSRVTTDYETLKAIDRRLRIGRRANSQEHQEGRHHRHGAPLHRQLQEARLGRPWRLYCGPARRNPRNHSQEHQFCKRAGCGNHSGFPRTSVPGYRIL